MDPTALLSTAAALRLTCRGVAVAFIHDIPPYKMELNAFTVCICDHAVMPQIVFSQHTGTTESGPGGVLSGGTLLPERDTPAVRNGQHVIPEREKAKSSLKSKKRTNLPMVGICGMCNLAL